MAEGVVKRRPGHAFYPVNPRQGAQIGEIQSLIGLFPPQLPKEQHSRRVVALAPTTNWVHCGNAGGGGGGGGDFFRAGGPGARRLVLESSPASESLAFSLRLPPWRPIEEGMAKAALLLCGQTMPKSLLCGHSKCVYVQCQLSLDISRDCGVARFMSLWFYCTPNS